MSVFVSRASTKDPDRNHVTHLITDTETLFVTETVENDSRKSLLKWAQLVLPESCRCPVFGG